MMAEEKWDVERIKKCLLELQIEGRVLKERHAQENHDLQMKYRALHSHCKHEHMNGAPYIRWCEDCGANWDTT